MAVDSILLGDTKRYLNSLCKTDENERIFKKYILHM